MDGEKQSGTIECERLHIRMLSEKELGRLLCDGQRLLTESVFTEEIRTAILYKIGQLKRTPEEAHPWLSYWLIAEKKHGLGIGLIGSKHLPDEEGYVELGYAVSQEWRNRGYMTEALEGFLDWLFQWPFCSGARLSIQSGNVPSIRVAEKCGFYRENMQGMREVFRYDF